MFNKVLDYTSTIASIHVRVVSMVDRRNVCVQISEFSRCLEVNQSFHENDFKLIKHFKASVKHLSRRIFVEPVETETHVVMILISRYLNFMRISKSNQHMTFFFFLNRAFAPHPVSHVTHPGRLL